MIPTHHHTKWAWFMLGIGFDSTCISGTAKDTVGRFPVDEGTRNEMIGPRSVRGVLLMPRFCSSRPREIKIWMPEC